MITELTLKNFRGFERHVVPLRPLTIIVGKNNAGKSTVVEALRLLSAITSRYQSLDYRRLPRWLDRNRRERAVYPSTKDFDFRHEAVFHRLGEAPAEISAKFTSGEKVEIFIGPELEVFGIIKDASGNVIESKGQANRVRLPQVSILPQIGPSQKKSGCDEGVHSQIARIFALLSPFSESVALYAPPFPKLQAASRRNVAWVVSRCSRTQGVTPGRQGRILVRSGHGLLRRSWVDGPRPSNVAANNVVFDSLRWC